MSDQTIDIIRLLEARGDKILEELRGSLFDGDLGKTLDVRYRLKEAAQMVGRSESSVRRAEEEGVIEAGERHESGRRAGYTLEQVNALRDHFGTRPYRGEDDEPVILSVQNFKGGVGKSTVACHAAQFFAQKGYRVLLVDCDSQASTTGTFGFNPDVDILSNATLLPFLVEDAEEDDPGHISEVIRRTYWDGLDLIPANLELYNAEYLMSKALTQDRSVLNRLKEHLTEAGKRYDIIIIDPPPALGMISISVIQAANAVLVPAPPSTIDFSSTKAFLSMMGDVLETLQGMGVSTSYKFVRFLVTKADLAKASQKDLRDAMGTIFSGHILPTALVTSVEYDNAALSLRTIYEASEGKTRAHDRARRNMDQVMNDLELEVRRTWPSHAPELLNEEGRA
jgi:chromosome partitioning protein